MHNLRVHTFERRQDSCGAATSSSIAVLYFAAVTMRRVALRIAFMVALASCSVAQSPSAETALIVAWQAPLDATLPCLILSARADLEDLRAKAADSVGCVGRNGVIAIHTSAEILARVFEKVPTNSMNKGEERPWLLIPIPESRLKRVRLSIAEALDLFQKASREIPEAAEEIQDRLISRFTNTTSRKKSDDEAEALLCEHALKGSEMEKQCVERH